MPASVPNNQATSKGSDLRLSLWQLPNCYVPLFLPSKQSWFAFMIFKGVEVYTSINVPKVWFSVRVGWGFGPLDPRMHKPEFHQSTLFANLDKAIFRDRKT